ncbi:MAG: diacylglycerol kinase [Trueperaceae bacterium]|nr:diacylglycerol kinase [Trueperaceae bacterium]
MKAARRFARSVGFAARGVAYGWRTQPHFRFETIAAVIAVGAALALGSGVAAVVLASALVLVAELANTAVEAAVDLAAPGPDVRAAAAKDAAAGAVLLAAIAAAGVGLAVFGLPLWGWLRAAVG